MCLAVPGKVVKLHGGKDADPVTRTASVDFHGSQVDVSLAMVPEAELGSWVLVHAGYAISLIDIDEARKTWEWLEAADLVEDMPEELRKATPDETPTKEQKA